MKKFTSVLVLLGMALMVNQPVLAQTLRDDIREDAETAVEKNVNEDTQKAVEDTLDSTVETRKEIIIASLDKAVEVMEEAESELATSPYASNATEEDCSTAIDAAQVEEETVRANVEAADDNASLVEARNAAVDWVVENKDVAKECMISLYLDGIQQANISVLEATLISEKRLLRYYKYYGLDTTTFEALIDETKTELDEARDDYAEAEDARTQETLKAASISSAEAVAAAARMYEEAYELDQELQAASEVEEDTTDEEASTEEAEETDEE